MNGPELRRHLLFTMRPALEYRDPSGLEPPLIDGWPGLGRIVLGMTRQGFDVELSANVLVTPGRLARRRVRCILSVGREGGLSP